MPVLRPHMENTPAWCELEHFAIIALAPGELRTWKATYQANKLVVVEGECQVDTANSQDDDVRALSRGGIIDLPAGEYPVTSTAATTIVELGGHWEDDCGGSGLFRIVRTDEPGDRGDPASYPKNTAFDRHFHDCDEYWVVVSGRGTAVTEDVLYEVGPGDCVATRMGHHHDLPLVEEPVVGVYFETTMRGQKRRGHLWEHTHGPAVRPAAE
jgi:mannose-6-phosphate isomerase-like protein (cupin superfamily)